MYYYLYVHVHVVQYPYCDAQYLLVGSASEQQALVSFFRVGSHLYVSGESTVCTRYIVHDVQGSTIYHVGGDGTRPTLSVTCTMYT